MAIVRPLTGSGSAGIVVDMINEFGEDSLFVKMAATMFGSTETTFYVIAVYFGADRHQEDAPRRPRRPHRRLRRDGRRRVGRPPPLRLIPFLHLTNRLSHD